MSELRGRYPGGPSRKKPEGEAQAPRRKVRLDTVEEIEARAAEGSQARNLRRRKKRVMIGAASFIVIGGGIGLWIGLQSHRTDEEVAQELGRGQARGVEFDLNKQADRLISEMWKTEALEKLPGGRGR
jgi:hypothetical protein